MGTVVWKISIAHVPNENCKMISPQTLAWTSLLIGGWAVGNGILHTAAVIKDHFKEYDRNFLYYLLNGHIIIFLGVFEMIASYGLRDGQTWGIFVSGTAAIGMIIYCAMIWKFLPSFLTVILQSSLIVMFAIQFFK